MEDEELTLPPGTILTGPGENIFVSKLIAQGGFSEIFLGKGELSNTEFALKVLRPGYAHLPKDTTRLTREGKTLYRLRHPSLLPVFHVGVHGPARTAYLVMALMRGRILRQVQHDMTTHVNRYLHRDGQPALKHQAKFPVRWALEIVVPVCAALHLLHTGGNVIHRDLKPENIDIEPDGTVVLFDVGVAMFTGDSARLTTAGMSLGTPLYMSPEQVLGSASITPSSDLFSLGSLLYELLTGDPPFAIAGDESVSQQQAIMMRIMNAPHCPLHFHRADIPAELAVVINKLLEKSPTGRYESAAQVGDLLSAILAREVSIPHTDPGPLAESLNKIPHYSGNDLMVPSLPPASDNPYLTISLARPPPHDQVHLADSPPSQPASPQAWDEAHRPAALRAALPYPAGWSADDTTVRLPVGAKPLMALPQGNAFDGERSSPVSPPLARGGTQRMDALEPIPPVDAPPLRTPEPPADGSPVVPYVPTNTARTFSQTAKSSTDSPAPGWPRRVAVMAKELGVFFAFLFVCMPIAYVIWRLGFGPLETSAHTASEGSPPVLLGSGSVLASGVPSSSGAVASATVSTSQPAPGVSVASNVVRVPVSGVSSSSGVASAAVPRLLTTSSAYPVAATKPRALPLPVTRRPAMFEPALSPQPYSPPVPAAKPPVETSNGERPGSSHRVFDTEAR